MISPLRQQAEWRNLRHTFLAISVFVSGPGGSSNLYSGFRESGASISVVSRRNWSRETRATFDTPVNFGAGIARGNRNPNPNCDATPYWNLHPTSLGFQESGKFLSMTRWLVNWKRERYLLLSRDEWQKYIITQRNEPRPIGDFQPTHNFPSDFEALPSCPSFSVSKQEQEGNFS